MAFLRMKYRSSATSRAVRSRSSTSDGSLERFPFTRATIAAISSSIFAMRKRYLLRTQRTLIHWRMNLISKEIVRRVEAGYGVLENFESERHACEHSVAPIH